MTHKRSLSVALTRLQVPTSKITWKAPAGKRIASVNSFGFGGSNVHVVLQEAGPRNTSNHTNGISAPATTGDATNGHATNDHTKALEAAPLSRRLYTLSAKNEQSLLLHASNLAAHLERDDISGSANIEDSLAYTLGSRRSNFQWRLATSSASIVDFAETLKQQNLNPTRASSLLTVCFVFTGQGAQWLGMGRELTMQYPVFARCMQRADECCAKMGATWSLTGKLLSYPLEAKAKPCRGDYALS